YVSRRRRRRSINHHRKGGSLLARRQTLPFVTSLVPHVGDELNRALGILPKARRQRQIDFFFKGFRIKIEVLIELANWRRLIQLGTLQRRALRQFGGCRNGTALWRG